MLWLFDNPSPFNHTNRERYPSMKLPSEPFETNNTKASNQFNPIAATGAEDTDYQEKLNLVQLVRPLGIVFALLIVIIVGYFLLFHHNYKRVNLKNDGYTYSFNYYPDGVETNSSQLNLITANAMTATFAPIPYKQDCAKQYPKDLNPFSFKLQGQIYPACSSNNNKTVFGFFEYDDVWHEGLFYSANGTTKVNNGFAKQAIQSVKIS